MSILVLRAYFWLIRFDRYLARNDFAALYNRVRRCGVGSRMSTVDPVARICSAIEIAGIWYWKEVLCLQRSAATVCLLRNNGVHAQLVIGAQHLPFKAHAWVEVDRRVVNDKPYVSEAYAVLDRC